MTSCGTIPVPMPTVDHVIPKFKGGTNNDSNLQLLCRDCHRIKTFHESNEGINSVLHVIES